MVALQANYRAYDLWPYDTNVRRQLVGSFTEVMGRMRNRLVVDSRTADTIMSVGKSVSESDPLYLLARIQFVFFYVPDASAAKPYIDRLEKVAPLLPETWLARSYYEGLASNPEGARDAALRGLSLNPQPKTEAALRAMTGD